MTGTGIRRFYQALHVECPRCGADVGDYCVRWEDGPTLLGVHRARDVAYNAMQAREPELWEGRRV